MGLDNSTYNTVIATLILIAGIFVAIGLSSGGNDHNGGY